MSAISLLHLQPDAYVRSALHRDERAFGESNCYVDLWIEVLSALGCEPLACLPFTVSTDFEGDQFTFFKPPLGDLLDLYGVDAQELDCWRAPLDHACEQLGRGRMVVTEADAFHLPDTAGTDYRTKHTKTTIAIESLDREGERLCYFHNAGYFALDGADFRGVLRVGQRTDDGAAFPFYAELVKLDRLVRRPLPELVGGSLALLRKHLSRRFHHNPMRQFAERLTTDIEWLKTQDLATYHAWAFATLRQCGASFELLGHHLRWLAENGHAGLAPAAADFDRIAQTAKAFILKGARAVSTKRPVDFSAMLSEMASSWESGMGRLVASQGR